MQNLQFDLYVLLLSSQHRLIIFVLFYRYVETVEKRFTLLDFTCTSRRHIWYPTYVNLRLRQYLPAEREP